MLDKDDHQIIEQIIDKKLKPIHIDIKSIHKDIRSILKFVKFFDKIHQHTRRRVNRIEDHLKLPPLY